MLYLKINNVDLKRKFKDIKIRGFQAFFFNKNGLLNFLLYYMTLGYGLLLGIESK